MIGRTFLLVLLALSSSCAPATSDSGTVERAFAQHRSGVEVTASGKVARLLTDESGPSGVHQRFIVMIDGSDQTVLIDHNVTIGTRAAASLGDAVVVHGEYVWNEQGGLIHFTHHDPEHTHEGGWIDIRGTRYQ